MDKKLTSLEEQLKDFIIKNRDFYNLAKKYTFSFRDFTPYIDYCIVKWDKKRKNWIFDSYYCHNQNKELSKKDANLFLLDLNIDGFSWGSLFSEIESRFELYMKNILNPDEVNPNSEKYEILRKEFFDENKNKIIDDWFRLTEKTAVKYFERILSRLREEKFEQINKLMA